MGKDRNSHRRKPVLLFLIGLSFFMIIPASAARAPEPVILEDTKDKYNIGLNLEYLEDKSRKLTYAEVSSLEYAKQWKKSESMILIFGYTDSAYWVRFKIYNNSTEDRFILLYPNYTSECVDLYTTDDKGSVIHRKSGLTIPFKQREIRNYIFAFYLNLKNSDNRIVYLRSQSGLGVYFLLSIYQNTRYSELIKNDYLSRGLFAGVFFIVIFFNIVLFIFSRKIIFINLSLVILFLGLYRMSQIGFLYEFIWPALPYWNNRAFVVFEFGMLIFLMQYSKQALRIKTVLPKTNILYNVFIFLSCIGIILPFVNPHFAIIVVDFTAFGFFIPFISSIILARKGDINAKFFFISFAPVVIAGLLIIVIVYFGLPKNTEIPLDPFLILSCILITTTTAYNYNRSMQDFRNSQEKIISLQKQATIELELKVEERTKELAEALDEVETINERLSESNAKLEGFGATLKRYLPMQLVDSIIRGEKITGSHTERRKITVFFSDIKAFTDTTDSLEAEELSALLNEYLTEMTKIAAKHGGTIDKFIGDAVMIFFGAPESLGDKEDALRAVRMAVEMQARMKELREKWFNQGIERPLQIRIGINTGVATVGDFGAEERLSYTTIGGQVNLASRLESLCEPGCILISHATWALVKDEFSCRACGEKQVKGIHHDVLVYEVATG